jgi:cell division ATPase FtsA
MVEREAVLVGIDVGTSKVCALMGEVSRDGRLTIMGHGTVPASGLKKGVVINIDQTVRSIADAVERAERLSGWKIDRAFVGVGGQHVESLNSPGQVAVTGHHREVLHVERRGFIVDGQEGVKDPLGMSALRLEVETHIVTASATATPCSFSVSDRTASADASESTTSSSILTPAAATHLVRFWTAVADAVTMRVSTSSRSALIPSGSLTPS